MDLFYHSTYAQRTDMLVNEGKDNDNGYLIFVLPAIHLF